MTAERTAADILFDMEDRLGSADRLLQGLAMIGRGMSDRQQGGAIEEVAMLAADMLDQAEEERQKALALSGPTTAAGAEYAQQQKRRKP